MGYTGKDKERCSRCIYSSTIGTSTITCEYMQRTGTMRSAICRGGLDCTVFESRARATRKKAKVEQPDQTKWKRNHFWDKGKAYELYNAGYADVDIAYKLGVSKSTICFWRNQRGLPYNRKGRE